MYTKILVPLDGSRLAECVLDHVETIALGCGMPEVILVSVTENLKVKVPVHIPGQEAVGLTTTIDPVMSPSGQSGITSSGIPVQDLFVQERSWTRTTGRRFSQADRYLDRIQRRLIKKGINAKTEVLVSDDVAAAIVDYAENAGVDLVLIASHGRSGISRWARGSVADKVFRVTCVPILMVRAPGCVAGI